MKSVDLVEKKCYEVEMSDGSGRPRVGSIRVRVGSGRVKTLDPWAGSGHGSGRVLGQLN